MRVGYARVSTDDQTLDLQRDALKRAKCREIYEEQASGKNTARPQLEVCLKSLRDGDTLIVWRLDRLGRSLGDLIRLTHELKERGLEHQCLKAWRNRGCKLKAQRFGARDQLLRIGNGGRRDLVHHFGGRVAQHPLGADVEDLNDTPRIGRDAREVGAVENRAL